MISDTMGIYAITNSTRNKVYIGSSVNCRKRINGHKHHLRKGKHHSPRLQNSWNKHGEIAFNFSIIEVVPNRDLLQEREQHWIDFYKSAISDYGYNIAGIAYSNKGIPCSDERRQKISAICQIKCRTPKFREEARQRMIGNKLSGETRNKISLAQKGRTDYNIKNAHEARRKKVKFTSNKGQETMYNSLKEVAISLNVNYDSVGKILRRKDGYSNYIKGNLTYV